MKPFSRGVMVVVLLTLVVGVASRDGRTGDGRTSDVAACRDIDYSDPAQGSMTFADEFDGTEINRSRWRVRDGTRVDFDQAIMRRQNVSVHGGLLDIMGKRLPPAKQPTFIDSRYARNQVRDYSTGYVDGIDEAGYGNAAGDRFGQKYGYFEIRAKLPSRNTMSRGIWPAFWLRADHQLGEIDPMEAFGGPTTRAVDPSATYQWNSWADTTQKSTTAHTQGTAIPRDGEPVWKDWHTYGVNWSPTCLRYTYDGQTVGLVPLSSKSYFAGDSFDDTFHVRLNLHIGSDYWGWADDAHTRPEFHYLVDYVRIFQGHENK